MMRSLGVYLGAQHGLPTCVVICNLSFHSFRSSQKQFYFVMVGLQESSLQVVMQWHHKEDNHKTIYLEDWKKCGRLCGSRDFESNELDYGTSN